MEKIRAFPPDLRALVHIFPSGQSQSPRTRALALLSTVGYLNALVYIFNSCQSVFWRLDRASVGTVFHLSTLGNLNENNLSHPTQSQSPSQYFHSGQSQSPRTRAGALLPTVGYLRALFHIFNSGKSQSPSPYFPPRAISEP